ncbi:hypothetical protein HYE39_03965 [Mycoplasmopsis bovis]|nr:hypothetical protein [Mycoplasmopsis bovis]QQH21196.1 hypothetical protein HYE39_03965 [Mycoplasmopsis bovis]
MRLKDDDLDTPAKLQGTKKCKVQEHLNSPQQGTGAPKSPQQGTGST